MRMAAWWKSDVDALHQLAHEVAVADVALDDAHGCRSPRPRRGSPAGRGRSCRGRRSRSAPASTSSSVRLEPIAPAPPVTSTLPNGVTGTPERSSGSRSCTDNGPSARRPYLPRQDRRRARPLLRSMRSCWSRHTTSSIGGSQINAIDLAAGAAGGGSRRRRLRRSGAAGRPRRRPWASSSSPRGRCSYRPAPSRIAQLATLARQPAARPDPRVRVAALPRRLLRRAPAARRAAALHGAVDVRLAARAALRSR